MPLCSVDLSGFVQNGIPHSYVIPSYLFSMRFIKVQVVQLYSSTNTPTALKNYAFMWVCTFSLSPALYLSIYLSFSLYKNPWFCWKKCKCKECFLFYLLFRSQSLVIYKILAEVPVYASLDLRYKLIKMSVVRFFKFK